MKPISNGILSAALFAFVVSATPTLALDIQAPDLDPGPQFDLPEEIAPPPAPVDPDPAPAANGNSGDDGGHTPTDAAGGGGQSLCLFGRWVTTYHADANGQPIPGTLERSCVRRLQN